MSSFCLLDSSSSAIFLSRYLALSCSFIFANLLVLPGRLGAPDPDSPFLGKDVIFPDLLLNYTYMYNEYKTCVIKDPRGQTHSPAGNDHYSHFKVLLFCDILGGRTDI